MNDFVIKEIVSDDIAVELCKIGFDGSYKNVASEKYCHKNLKIYSLTVAQANILKQTALTVGADCATHREVITGKIEKSDCILGGSVSQLKKISQKLKFQPFGLKSLSEKIDEFLGMPKHENTLIVGILNLTPNSFSDGGAFLETSSAIEHLESLIKEGADIIDIGAESTKPGAETVAAEVQLERIVPVLHYIKNNGLKIPISIDTRSSVVAKKCAELGARIINDVSGFDFDAKLVEVCAETGGKVIIQHSAGEPENMQKNPCYESVIDEIYLSLKKKIDFAISNGIKKENIIVDPGIGFGKTREHNFEIISRIEEFYGLGCPVMLGVSRKSLLDMAGADNFTKDIYTVALNTLAVERKVDFIRVHNVKLHKKLLELLS